MRNLLIFCLAICLTACASRTMRSGGSSLVNDPGNNAVESSDVKEPIDLTAYLMRVAGVNISGSGANARISVRGPVSFQSGASNPLYVLNGSKIGYDYSTVYNSVDARDIKRVRVLKGADETAMYGAQGAAGVIEITLRD
ncbi:MAG: TonB-dependent receptor plug domain-containing protein [Bacteroidota bacterium]